MVNGKPAIEWVMDRYQVTVDKDSQIRNDPNDWSADPRYIIIAISKGSEIFSRGIGYTQRVMNVTQEYEL
ncbi:type ISP restriction/modification enzyme [Thermosynechococcus sp. PP42]|nr:type ISP restriction/modification enzyme [Thermosynechococcus sp. PP42]MDR5638088.1 type ISP restriction/modification enzyme [Thermosynechococcus sp. PP42]